MAKHGPVGRLLCSRDATIAVVAAGMALFPQASSADEGGVSFWLTGQFGSLAAVPQQAGWSLSTVYYHTNVNAGGDVAFSRQVTRGGISATLPVNFNANLKADANLALLAPSYVFAQPVLGGQLALSMAGIFGSTKGSVDATLTGLGPLGLSASGSRSDSVTGVGDLYPHASLRWNQGVNNYMIYGTGDVPVGAYDPNRLANLGIGHGAADGGLGYTYFNPETGHEFSAVTGLTYNLRNTATNYTNGFNWHLDWGASQFLTKQLQIGVVGYVYHQLTGDSGTGDRVGTFKSRVVAVGPQLGYIFPIGDHQAYLNLKGYKEFDASHRAAGWNAWVTFSISLTAPDAATPPLSRRAMTSK